VITRRYRGGPPPMHSPHNGYSSGEALQHSGQRVVEVLVKILLLDRNKFQIENWLRQNLISND